MGARLAQAWPTEPWAELRYLLWVTIEVDLTTDGFGVIYKSSDVLTGQDLLEADARLPEEIERNPEIRYLLVDHSAIPQAQVDSRSLQVLAQRAAGALEMVEHGIVAIAAPNDVLFGLSRMWQMQAEQPGLVAFVARTRAEAIAWLEQELAKNQLPFRLTE